MPLCLQCALHLSGLTWVWRDVTWAGRTLGLNRNGVMDLSFPENPSEGNKGGLMDGYNPRPLGYNSKHSQQTRQPHSKASRILQRKVGSIRRVLPKNSIR